MAEVGAYYITIMPDMSKFTGAVNSAMGSGGTEAGNKFSTGFGSIIGGTAIGNMLGGLAQRVGSSIMSGLSTGINRIDTIQNFPKVMESLGYTSEAASSSIALIMEHLDGLPSATQDVVGLTQAIADSTGDLDLATKAALGFNDMMLANGASAAEVAQAQGVFNRVLGKGNATAAQWQSLQSVMPAQLSAVARQLLGEGASVEELRDQLNDGTVSWNDFLGAIVELDESGYVDAAGKQISSFADQARANSVGIGTAIANIRNRIGAGWADILDSIGREDISHAIDTMSYGIRDAMKRVGDAIDYLKERIGQTPIAENAAKVLSAIGEAISSIWNDGGPEILKTLTDALVALIDGALQWMADNADVVKAAVWGIAGALAALAGFKLGTELAKLPAIIGGIGTALSANPLLIGVTVFAALAAAAYGFFTKTETGRAIVEKFVNGCKELWANLKDEWNRTVEKIKQNLADNAVQWNKFKQNISNVVNNIKKAVVDRWNEIKKAVTDSISSLVKGATDRWNALKKSVTDTVNGLKAALIDRWNAIKASVTGTIDSLKASVSNKWNAIKSTVTGIIDSLNASVSDKWNAIKSTISGVINAIKGIIQGVLNAISGIWNSIFGNMEGKTSTTFNGIKGTIGLAVGAIKGIVGGLATALGATWNGIKTAASTAWDSIKSTAGTKWNGIKGAITDAIGSAKSSFSTKVGEMKSLVANFRPTFSKIAAPAIGSISGVLSSMWQSIANFRPSFPEIAAPVIGSISGALDTIRQAVSNFMPSFPRISWPTPSMPHIPTPHFSLSWNSILGGLVKVPRVSFNGWWRTGGFFDEPSVIGVGEAGPEMVLPQRGRLMDDFADAIASKVGGGVLVTGNNFYVRNDRDIDAIADAINQKAERERRAAL